MPVTIKQLKNAPAMTSGEQGFTLDGRDLYQVTIVGLIMNADEQATNLQYTIDDGTDTIMVKMWVDADADDQFAEKRAQWKEGVIVRVIGTLRSFNNAKSLVAYSIQPVTDKNEYTFHFIEVVHTHLRHTKGPPPTAAAAAGGAYGAPSAMGAGALPGMAAPYGAPVQQAAPPNSELILKFFQTKGESSDAGCTVADAANALSSNGMGIEQVRAVVNELVEEGHLYSTIDDDHCARPLHHPMAKRPYPTQLHAHHTPQLPTHAGGSVRGVPSQSYLVSSSSIGKSPSPRAVAGRRQGKIGYRLRASFESSFRGRELRGCRHPVIRGAFDGRCTVRVCALLAWYRARARARGELEAQHAISFNILTRSHRGSHVNRTGNAGTADLSARLADTTVSIHARLAAPARPQHRASSSVPVPPSLCTAFNNWSRSIGATNTTAESCCCCSRYKKTTRTSTELHLCGTRLEGVGHAEKLWHSGLDRSMPTYPTPGFGRHHRRHPRRGSYSRRHRRHSRHQCRGRRFSHLRHLCHLRQIRHLYRRALHRGHPLVCCISLELVARWHVHSSWQWSTAVSGGGKRVVLPSKHSSARKCA